MKHILPKELHLLYVSTHKCIRELMAILKDANTSPGVDRTQPTIATLQELVVAALMCPGFSESKKATIVLTIAQTNFRNILNTRGVNYRFGGTDSYSTEWPFQALVKKPGVDDRLIHYIARLIRDATLPMQNLSLADMQSIPMFGDIYVRN